MSREMGGEAGGEVDAWPAADVFPVYAADII